MQAARSPGRPRSAGRPRGRQIHDGAGFSAPRERARARIDEGIQPGPRLPQVVQLAAEIGQCLGIARFRPEGACDPLTWDRSAAGMENQEGDELLLSRAWWTGGDTAGGENTEPSEQLDAHRGGTAAFQDYMRLRSARDTPIVARASSPKRRSRPAA
jgi:hypothetical protein